MAFGSRNGSATAGKTELGGPAQPDPIDLASVVREYESPLLRYVARLIGSRYDEAQDVVQDVFLKLHRQMSGPKQVNISNMRSWLYRVAHNLAMDYGRGRKRRRNLEEKALSDPAVMDRVKGSKLADARDVERSEAGKMAFQAVQTLPEEQRNVVLLKVVQGLTLKEISGITGMKIGTVNYRLTQGLRTLAGQLKDLGES